MPAAGRKGRCDLVRVDPSKTMFLRRLQQDRPSWRLDDVESLGVDAGDTVADRIDEAFTEFYRDAYPGAVRLAWLLTHDHDAAEDVVQDAFVRLRPRMAMIEHRGGYLRTAIVNGCRDRARSVGRADAGLRRIQSAGEVTSTDKPAELLDVIAALPYKQRAVLVLRYWADLPDQDIADILGVRPATIRSTTARALARLRRELPNDR